MLNDTIYGDIENKIGRYFIPIIILLYLVAMFGNAYSTVCYKWLTDIKYISYNPYHLWRNRE